MSSLSLTQVSTTVHRKWLLSYSSQLSGASETWTSCVLHAKLSVCVCMWGGAREGKGAALLLNMDCFQEGERERGGKISSVF